MSIRPHRFGRGLRSYLKCAKGNVCCRRNCDFLSVGHQNVLRPEERARENRRARKRATIWDKQVFVPSLMYLVHYSQNPARNRTFSGFVPHRSLPPVREANPIALSSTSRNVAVV